MILRPLDPIPATSTDFLPAWSVVEQSQRQITNECWMITQPSHAALAGEFAARMTGVNLPNLDAPVIRAIALHDAGWGMPDAQAIMQSRSIGQGSAKVVCCLRCWRVCECLGEIHRRGCLRQRNRWIHSEPPF